MTKRIVVLIMITTCIFAQLPCHFENIAHAKDFKQITGSAWDVDISPNGTIFIAYMDGGILVYDFNGSKLSQISQTIDGDPRVTNISAVNDSLILVSDYRGRLISYEYDGDTLIQKAEIAVQTPKRITLVNDSTIFLSCERNGLKVFHFDGTQFVLKTSIDDVDWVYDSIMLNDSTMLLGAGGTLSTYSYHDSILSLITQIDGIGSEQFIIAAKALHLADDGTIFCANYTNGLFAFTYQDSVFSMKAIEPPPFLSMYEMEGFNDVEVRGDIIYIAGISGGVYAYEYTGNSFVLLDNRDEVYYGCFNIEVRGNIVFVAFGSSSLWVYKFNGTAFSELDHISPNGSSYRLAFDNSGRIFSANGADGLRVYRSAEDGFINIAHLNDSRYVMDVAVTPDGGTVFVANKQNGLGVYSFDGNNFIQIGRYLPQESEYYYYSTNDINSVELLGENIILFTHKVNMSDYMSGKNFSFGEARTYIWNGSSFADLSFVFSYPVDIYDNSSGLVSDVAFVNDDSVVVGLGEAGISTGYRKQINTGGYVNDVDILPDGTILTANAAAGLKAYRNDSGFSLVNSINNGGSAKNIFRFDDGTLLLANGEGGLRSYRYDSELVCTAYIDDGGSANDVVVLPDSTIILANGEDGLRAYRFDGFLPDPDPDDPDIPGTFKLYQNYPNPFNPTTTLSFELLEQTNIQMMIFDITGRKIYQWSYQNQSAGTYEITWNGKDRSGNPVPSGVYIYRMVAGGFVESRKMVLLK